jgi:predicted phage gp36 major capsid-like protein
MSEMRELPERVIRLESQIVQLRQEMRDEFPAIRSESRAELRGGLEVLGDDLRGEIAGAVKSVTTAIEETNTHMRMLHEETLSTTRREVGAVREAIVETNTHMRMLQEEALSRISTVGEGRKIKRKK